LLSDMGYQTLGVSGYSMGANIAAFVAAASSRPVACAALAASHSPGPVFTRGALAAAVDWDALGGFELARTRLGEVLGEATVLRHPAPPHTAAALVVGADADGYIPRDATEDLARHWPGSELRFIAGGHASVLIRKKATLSAVIMESLDRLTEWRQGASTLTS
ncbi:MAG: alpha/beta hydrolase family protein, partial [Acidimicrobiia bacterium]|nr:alpha/beta hydrolase family protein [Acidimicrobiia bacterium]